MLDFMILNNIYDITGGNRASLRPYIVHEVVDPHEYSCLATLIPRQCAEVGNIGTRCLIILVDRHNANSLICR